MSLKQSRKSSGIFESSLVYNMPEGEIVLYSSPDGSVSLDVRLKQDTIWLTQKQMTKVPYLSNI
jgi:hypothetical protein